MRVTLLTLGILFMFGGKKGRDLFHNLFSCLYWTATFLSQRQSKSTFTRHLANTKKHKSVQEHTKILLESSLFNTKNSPQNLSLIFRLFSFLLAVSLSILCKTLHFSLLVIRKLTWPFVSWGRPRNSGCWRHFSHSTQHH